MIKGWALLLMGWAIFFMDAAIVTPLTVEQGVTFAFFGLALSEFLGALISRD